MRKEHCRSCSADIVWACTVPVGVPIPVDFEPVDGGNILLEVRSVGDSSRIRVLAHVVGAEEARATGGPTYRAHFASCPDQDAWRRRKTPEPI